MSKERTFNKFSPSTFNINLNGPFTITGVTKIVEATAERISVKLNDCSVLITGDKLELINIDLNTNLLEGRGSVFKIKINKNKYLHKTY